MKIEIRKEEIPLTQPFRISGHEFHVANALLVTLHKDGHTGRGEAQGVYYLGETLDSIYEQAMEASAHIEAGVTREQLMELLPPGGARNAIDCALWDLECKASGETIWKRLGLQAETQTTVCTVGIEATPDLMAEHAAKLAKYPIIKVKLDHHEPLERITAIRNARADAQLVVDANQGWSFEQLKELAPKFADLGVSMIEQPLARGQDKVLENYASPIPLCADESCLHLGEVALAARRYQMVNIKLDKTGGLTGALALAGAAKGLGLGLMVGNMMGSSLAMAPSYVIAQMCEFVDLDGPLLLAEDRENPMQFLDGGQIPAPSSDLWG